MFGNVFQNNSDFLLIFNNKIFENLNIKNGFFGVSFECFIYYT